MDHMTQEVCATVHDTGTRHNMVLNGGGGGGGGRDYDSAKSKDYHIMVLYKSRNRVLTFARWGLF